MTCIKCAEDPKPEGYGSPRKCAFDEAGHFTSNNWACGTIMALIDRQIAEYGHLEDMEVDTRWTSGETQLSLLKFMNKIGSIWYHTGWIILTRYKHRGQTDLAMRISEGGEYGLLTLQMAERLLTAPIQGA